VTRTTNTAPVFYRRCLVHGALVSFDGEGRMLGRCDGCDRDVAEALRRMKQMPKVRVLS
jgi:hypothetical protein